MSNVKIAKKLSMKALAGGRPAIPAAGQVNWIAKIAGIASGVKYGESNYGPWVALLGNFIAECQQDAIDAKTGEVLRTQKIDSKTKKPVIVDGQPVMETVKNDVRYRTGTMFLPDVALGLILPALESAGKGAQIQFAFRIGVERDDTAATGYIYTAESLIEPEENDPLELLVAKAMDNGQELLENKSE